jgi:hypothetical protein
MLQNLHSSSPYQPWKIYTYFWFPRIFSPAEDMEFMNTMDFMDLFPISSITSSEIGNHGNKDIGKASDNHQRPAQRDPVRDWK